MTALPAHKLKVKAVSAHGGEKCKGDALTSDVGCFALRQVRNEVGYVRGTDGLEWQSHNLPVQISRCEFGWDDKPLSDTFKLDLPA